MHETRFVLDTRKPRLPHDIPERFNLVFLADGTHIPCHVIWRKEKRIGVAFD
jgi:hypothetical protein